jgi:aspartate kinase
MGNDFLIKFTENVALVTLNNIKSDVHSLLNVFQIVSDEDICIDMISQTAPLNNCVNLSFTVDDNDTAKVISIIYKFKEVFSGLTTQILSNNTKILITSDRMRTEAGIATKIFKLLASENIPVLIINTSETEISMLIAEEFALQTKEILSSL